MVVLIILIVMGANTIMSVAAEIRKYVSHRESMDVVRDLAERGMSADEIERVMTAKPESPFVHAARKWQGHRGNV